MSHAEAMKKWTLVDIADTNEDRLLERMYDNLNNSMGKQAESYERNEDKDEFIYVVVDGEVFPFILGGPQCAALQEFIAYIEYENGYDPNLADWVNQTTKRRR